MKIIRFLLISLFSLPAFSASGHIYLGTTLAASFAKLNNTEPSITYVSGATITDNYPRNSSRVSSSEFSVNGGYEFVGKKWKPAIALGMGLYNTPIGYGFGGQVIETPTGDPSTTLYNYSYNINNTRVMAEVQFSWMMKVLSPFLNFGAGPSWNRVNDYSESVVAKSGYVALPPFKTRTNTTIAYQAGFGVFTAFNFSKSKAKYLQERITLGYRFVNLGTTSFGSRGSSYPHKLSTGSLNANDVYLGYSHLF